MYRFRALIAVFISFVLVGCRSPQLPEVLASSPPVSIGVLCDNYYPVEEGLEPRFRRQPGRKYDHRRLAIVRYLELGKRFAVHAQLQRQHAQYQPDETSRL